MFVLIQLEFSVGHLGSPMKKRDNELMIRKFKLIVDKYGYLIQCKLCSWK